MPQCIASGCLAAEDRYGREQQVIHSAVPSARYKRSLLGFSKPGCSSEETSEVMRSLAGHVSRWSYTLAVSRYSYTGVLGTGVQAPF